MPRLSASSQGTRRIPEVLGDLGIRFVIVEHLRKTYVDGATFWLDRRSPVVALSLRYDRVDNFWFTLMHELAHVLQGYRTQGFIDDYLVGKDAAQTEDKPEIEQEADHLASEWLVPRGTLAAFIAANHPYYSKEVVEAFAREISVHPGIVVGRLQNMGKMPYANLRGLLTKVREHFS